MADPNSNISETPAATAPPPAPPAPAKPALPPKPAPPAKAPPKKKGEDRRFFLFRPFALAWTAFTATMVGMTLWTLRFLVPNVLSEPPSKFKIPLRDEPDKDGVVVDRFKDNGFWLVRNEGIIYALSTTCTHLGCTPNWLEKEEKFKCPCHGSGFKITGINFEGPAPRPLERWALNRGPDRQLIVDKSKKFQQELGQWSIDESYVKV
jgi:cytochrome b6-f complex iron-sulfur subunit